MIAIVLSTVSALALPSLPLIAGRDNNSLRSEQNINEGLCQEYPEIRLAAQMKKRFSPDISA